MSADRVVKSKAQFFNTGTWAGGTWRQKTISKRGDNIEAAGGSSSVQGYPAESGLPQTH